MRPRHIPISRQIRIQPRQNLRTTRLPPPITHKIHNNSKDALQHHPRRDHPIISISSQFIRKGTARLRVGEDGVALGAQRQGQELGADVRGDAGEDDLGFILGADGGAEVGVVPGVDFAVAADQGRGRVEGGDLLGEEAVGARFGGGGEDDGEGEEGGDGAVGDHVVAVGDGVEVADLEVGGFRIFGDCDGKEGGQGLRTTW